MNADSSLPRRHYLRLAGGAVAAISLAGCTEGDSGGATPGTASPRPDSTGGGGTPTKDELDLREANVVDVSVEGGDGSYDVSVALHHDDEGEPGYANWWQVEALDGDQFGRRNLSHAHGTTEFTRSTTVDVPADQPCVVVRGHDQTHGYGGQAMLLSLDAESVVPKRQGSDPQSFTEADCPD